MPELSTLRAEIKSWERNFKTENGRDASVQDIRDQPAIAEKYRRYKKLSKAAAAALIFSNLSQSTPSDGPPSTPPRIHKPDPRSSLIRSTKRTIEPVGLLSSFNPFSPVKNKGKQRGTESNLDAHSNPFMTPVKESSKLVVDPAASIDPFPIIQPLPSQVIKTKAPTDALSRARKRLRGEPVSPSPAKEKRPRINSQTSLPFSTFETHSADSDGYEDPDNGDATNSSFVNDSPVKRPAGNKSFKLLFEEAVPQNVSLRSNRGRLSRSQTASELFANSSYKTATTNLFLRSTDDASQGQDKGSLRKKHDIHKSSNGKQREYSSPEGSKPGGTKLSSRSDTPRRSGKRSLSDSEMGSTDVKQTTSHIARLPLLPPSPPPPDPSSSRYKPKMNEKGASRKKAKMLQETDEDGEGDSSEDYPVKLIDHIWEKMSRTNQNDVDIDSDTLLFAPRRSGVNSIDPQEEPVANMDVNLPERLQHVLAISPPKGRDREEEQVVRGLLHGGRAARYDPRRGGEIWEVGEGGDDIMGDTEGEDDWEGEPVPWEIGEL